MKSARRFLGFVLFVSAVSLAGCGPKTTSVGGKVTADGKAVTGGSLVFSPIGGAGGGELANPATVEVKEDGTFPKTVVGVGKLRVTYNAPGPKYPEGHTPKPSEPAPMSPYQGMVPEKTEIDVSGDTTIEVILLKGKGLPGGPPGGPTKK